MRRWCARGERIDPGEAARRKSGREELRVAREQGPIAPRGAHDPDLVDGVGLAVADGDGERPRLPHRLRSLERTEALTLPKTFTHSTWIRRRFASSVRPTSVERLRVDGLVGELEGAFDADSAAEAQDQLLDRRGGRSRPAPRADLGQASAQGGVAARARPAARPRATARRRRPRSMSLTVGCARPTRAPSWVWVHRRLLRARRTFSPSRAQDRLQRSARLHRSRRAPTRSHIASHH